jgi:hypothetical protein
MKRVVLIIFDFSYFFVVELSIYIEKNPLNAYFHAFLGGF